MVQPRADALQWVQLGMVREDDSATCESTGLLHDWTPIAQEAFKVAAPRAAPPRDGGKTFLWQVEQDVLRTLDLILCCAHCDIRGVISHISLLGLLDEFFKVNAAIFWWIPKFSGIDVKSQFPVSIVPGNHVGHPLTMVEVGTSDPAVILVGVFTVF